MAARASDRSGKQVGSDVPVDARLRSDTAPRSQLRRRGLAAVLAAIALGLSPPVVGADAPPMEPGHNPPVPFYSELMPLEDELFALQTQFGGHAVGPGGPALFGRVSRAVSLLGRSRIGVEGGVASLGTPSIIYALGALEFGHTLSEEWVIGLDLLGGPAFPRGLPLRKESLALFGEAFLAYTVDDLADLRFCVRGGVVGTQRAGGAGVAVVFHIR